MAQALAFSVFNARQVCAPQFPHASGEPGVRTQAPTCLKAQACFKRSFLSNNLQVSCARKSCQITRAGNSSCGGCQPSSSFIGVSPERYRCIANRQSGSLTGNRSKNNYSRLLPSRQAVIKAEENSGSDGFNKLELAGNDAINMDAALAEQFNRFAKAILSQDEKMAEQVIEEMGYSGDSVLDEQFERFKTAMAAKNDETAEQVMKEMGYTDDSAIEEQFNRFAKAMLSNDDEIEEQVKNEMGGSGDSALEDQFNRFAKAIAGNDDGMAEQILKEMGHSVDINEMKGLVKEVSDMQGQLQELQDQVLKLVEEGDMDTAFGLIDANLEVISEQLEAGYKGVEQIAMLDTLASLRLAMGELEEAEKILDQIKDLIDDVGLDSLAPLSDRILEHMGSMYTELGKPEEGLPYFLKSLEIQEELVGEDSPLIADTLLGLAATYNDMENSASAIEVYNRILSIIEKTRGPMDETLALPLSKMGHCLLEEERVNEAEAVLQRALKIVDSKYGAKDGRVGIAKCALARAYASGGAMDEAVSLYQDGIQIMEGCNELDHDDSSMETARTDLAEVLSLIGRSDEAEDLWETNLIIKERLFGPTHPSLIVHLQNLATAYAVSGKHSQAVPLLRRSLKLAVEDLGPDAPQVSVPLEMLATALHHMDRQDEAEPIARRALEIREAHFDPDSAVIGEACNCLASILHANGKYEEALSMMKRVLDIQERELGSDNPQLVLSLELIIMLLNKCGRAEETEPYYMKITMLSTAGGDDDDDDDDDDADDDEIDFRGDLLYSRPAPASNMFDDADGSDIIDI